MKSLDEFWLKKRELAFDYFERLSEIIDLEYQSQAISLVEESMFRNAILFGFSERILAKQNDLYIFKKQLESKYKKPINEFLSKSLLEEMGFFYMNGRQGGFATYILGTIEQSKNVDLFKYKVVNVNKIGGFKGANLFENYMGKGIYKTRIGNELIFIREELTKSKTTLEYELKEEEKLYDANILVAQ